VHEALAGLLYWKSVMKETRLLRVIATSACQYDIKQQAKEKKQPYRR